MQYPERQSMNPRQLQQTYGVVSLLSLTLSSMCGLPQVWMRLRTMMFSPENNSREPHLPFGADNGCPHC